jgi:uncharacterized OB-fold protein
LADSTIAAMASRPIVPFLTVGDNGAAIMANRCALCDAVVLRMTMACPRCGAQDSMAREALAETGKLYNFTIVHRSLPGVPTPFVSAIVELDGGGVLKGTLETPPEDVTFDMPVRLRFRTTVDTGDEGQPYLVYYFTALEGAQE